MKAKIRLVRFNPVTGDVRGNTERIVAAAREAAGAGVDAVVFPQSALGGACPGDLQRRGAFVDAVDAELRRLERALPEGLPLVLGTPLRMRDGVCSAMVAYGAGGGRGRRVVCSSEFAGAGTWGVVEAGEGRLGVLLGDVAKGDIPAGACDALVRVQSMVYLRGQERAGEAEAEKLARRFGVPVLGVNLSGAQDGVVFDGAAVGVAADGTVGARSGLFGEGAWDVEFGEGGAVSGKVEEVPGELAAVWGALRTGIRDYAVKNRFPGALVALSGGIDSALVAALAVDALGAGKVMGVTLPSSITSSETLEDALELARRLGIPCLRIPIAPAVDAFGKMLEAGCAGVDWAAPLPGTLVEENLQARVRGVVVMALSNRYGHLVLATGNKSEVSTGYATLYGDMCGGFAPIKEVPKTMVFALSRWRNGQGDGEVIPASTIERPPSAELRPGQKDSDSLPPYDVLDPLLERYMEGREGVAELVASGVPEDVARRVARLVGRSEYKRRQGAPGVVLEPARWRMPITNGFME
ncbi:MAG: NAD(+) synthase [Kiritimatiellae bacterium]|nr:NAD(+) synthase [Kiritimatiellia bacterium]